jgi:hypothetical protein
VIAMPNPDPPLSLTAAIQRLSENLSQISTLEAARQAMDHLQAPQQARIAAAIAIQQENRLEQWSRQITALLAPGAAMRQAAATGAFSQLGRMTEAFLASSPLTRFRLDTPGLDRLLGELEGWQTLGRPERDAVAEVLEASYETATSTDPDVPDDLVSGLEETARNFALAQDGFLSPERQRQLFVYVCGLLMLLALMQASFTSKTADALIEKTITLSPAALLTMAAAGKAWDRFMPRPEGTGDDTADEGDGN